MGLLECRGISKRFGGVVALRGVDFECTAGEIHALLGENGAGKSTLVKIMTGVLTPDEGQVFYQGEPVRLTGPAHASRLGIAPVFQELSLLPDLTVAQNIFIAREPRNSLGFVRFGEMARRAGALFEQLGIQGIPLDVPVKELSLAERQLVEIAKALSHDPQVLILDEGTSALGQREVHQLTSLLKKLRSEGKTIVFISHRMGEVWELADRATVFRDGRRVDTVSLAEVDPQTVIEMMIGRKVVSTQNPGPLPEAERQPLLTVRDLHWEDQLRSINFTLHKGEILGLAGLEGQGQGHLLLALFGAYAGLRGEIEVHGRPVRLNSPRDALKEGIGIALVPQDRKSQGLLLPLSVRENMSMAVLSRKAAVSPLSLKDERQQVERVVRQIAVKTPSVEQAVRNLSGGNQQKVVIGKWLLSEALIYLLYDPTRGIDVGTKQELYQLLRDLAAEGKGILLYSTDLSELISLCHRVMVMYEGRIVDVLEGSEITETNLLRSALGLTAQPPAQANVIA